MGSIAVPFTTTVTNHGLLIVANGQTVGAVTEWAPSHDRDVTPVYEFGNVTAGLAPDVMADPGEPYENVPGNVRNMRITVQRYDIYTKHLELAFGTPDLDMLTKQTSAIQLREFWSSPDGTLDFNYVYYGAWFSNLGRTHSATGDRIVKVAATLMYTRRRKL